MENEAKICVPGGLLHIGPMSESIWINILTAAVRLGMGVLRIFIFAKLLSLEEMGVWGTATMGMTIAAPLVCLGMNQGIERYVSVYEVAGRLRWFFRRGFFGAIAVTVVLGAAAACLFPVWRDVLFPTSIGYSPNRSELLTWLVVVNFTVLGVYFVLMGFIAGLRMFRLAAAMEMLFGVLTTFAAACAIYFYPFATALLLIHFVSVLACFLLGTIMLYVAVNRILQTEFSGAAIDGFEPAGDFKAVLVQLGRFGFVGLVGATAWQVVTFVSYYLTYKTAGRDAAGEYTVMLRIAQPIYTLALSAWAVIYTHTASAWQKGEHKLATERMDMMFRRVAMMVMLCGWAVIISEPLWSWILGKKYSGAGEYLPGLMLMFAAMSNVLLLMNWGRIFGRQWSVVLAGLTAGVLNVVSYYVLRRFGGAGFSSLAAGVGVFAGVVLMTVFYFTRWKINISPRSAIMLLLPAMFLLTGKTSTTLCAVAVTAAACYFAFTPSERKNLLGFHIRYR